MVRSSGEVHLCGRCGCGIFIIWADISRAERPDAIDGQRLAAGILQQSVKSPGSQVVSGNKSTRLGIPATRELPDEQVVAEASEIERSQSHTPRRVQPITVLETPQEPACGAVNVHEAQAWAVGFKARTFHVERIGDNNVVADGLHVERHIAAWQVFIYKGILGGAVIVIAGIPIGVVYGQLCGLKCAVIDVDATLSEIGCVQVGLAIDEGASQARVAGPVGGFDYDHSKGRSHSWIPPSNRPVIRGKEDRKSVV